MRSTHLVIAITLSTGLLSACDDNDLSNPDHVRTWATNGSALAVYSHVHEPFAYALGESTFSDPMCPVRTDDGEVATITGGCVTEDGQRFSGTATITRGEGDVHALVLDRYGSYDDPDFRTLTSGTASVTPRDGTLYDFEVDITTDALTSTRITYTGTVDGDYTGPSLWNGSGRVTRDGFGEPLGTVRVATVDELRDTDVCSNQPLSGQTTIEAEGDRVVVTYDGATDCDQDKAATWTFNGRDRGRITGIDCAVGTVGGRTAGAPALLLAMGTLLLSLVLVRRRARCRVTGEG